MSCTPFLKLHVPLSTFPCSRTVHSDLPHSSPLFDLQWCRVVVVMRTARRSNQSILKQINPEDSLEGLMLKLKLQYFSHLMQRADSLEKILMLLEKIEGRRRSGQENEMVGWHHRLNGHESDQNPGDGQRQESLVCCSP